MISVTVPFLSARVPLQPPSMPLRPSAWLGHEPFAFWLVDALRPRRVVELGVHHGASFCAFGEAILSLGLDAECVGVDSWDANDQAGRHAAEEALAELRSYHDPRYGHFSRLLRTSFDAAAAEMAPGSVDLLHVDGLHSYDAVRHDYEVWAPKLSDRAVVLFHDIAVVERGFGVHRFWAEISAGRPNFTFDHAHGLGVLGHGPNLPDSVMELLAAEPVEAERIRALFATLGERAVRDRAQRAAPRMQSSPIPQAPPLVMPPSPWRDWLVRGMPRPVRSVLRRVVG
ncbi:MAG TPA: class I SAM-dependent methyltransferase [Acetobacteraceae bacterium]|nr:class I SAM-dependent methyltransferase [Acetobacteraceae bacterium]